jgi:hypothetical protein
VRKLARVGIIRNSYNLVSKPQKKRALTTPRCTSEGNNIMFLTEMSFGHVDYFQLAQDIIQWWTLKKTVIELQAQ